MFCQCLKIQNLKLAEPREHGVRGQQGVRARAVRAGDVRVRARVALGQAVGQVRQVGGHRDQGSLQGAQTVSLR